MQLPNAETLDDVVEDHSFSQVFLEPQLIVALEADRPLAGGARYSLAGVHEVVIGRGAERSATRQTRDGLVTLSIRLPARSLSSIHARLIRVGDQWILEDAQSRNGSFMDGLQVEQAAFREDSVVQLGHVFFLLHSAMPVDKETAAMLDALDLEREPLGLRTLVPSLTRGFEGLCRVARACLPILLLGETGTGKELVARAIHLRTGRRGQFVTVKCGSLSDKLGEGQLLGRDRGGDSSGSDSSATLVRAAHQGTLFLDEIGDLQEGAQTALLRALDQGEPASASGAAAAKTDVLVISAAHHPAEGPATPPRLRQDLLARLAGRIVTLPPLRERLDDFGLILADILRATAAEHAERIRLTKSAANALFAYHWPFNVRELQHILLAALALSEDGVIHLAHLPASIAAAAPQRVPTNPGEDDASVLSDEERRLRAALIAQLRQQRGNVAAVARAMKKAPMQIHRWMKRLGVDPGEFRKAKGHHR